MSKFFSPEQLKKSDENPVSESVRETPEQIADRAYNDYVRQRLEERTAKKFLSLEHKLDLVFSDKALEAYREAGYVLRNNSELSFFRLVDLDAALIHLEQLKDQLPDRYQADVKKVLGHEETIKQIFYDYRPLREKGEARHLHDVAALLSTLETLRRIDSGRFPVDLVDVSDDERRQDEALKKHRTRDSQ